MSKPSAFSNLFRSNSAAAAKAKAEGEDDVIDRKVDDAEDDMLDPDDPEDDKDEDPDAKKARLKKLKAKKKAAEGDDDSDDADDKDEKAKAARSRERGRIAAIMSSEAAAANPAMALRLATSTNMSRNAAIATLKDIGPPNRGSSARDRLMGVDVPDVGQGGTATPSGARATAEAIILAGRRARGET